MVRKSQPYRRPMFNQIRWSDETRYFGFMSYTRDRGYTPLAVILGSGDGDEHGGCRLRLSGFGHTVIFALPPIIQPWRRKVVPGWDEATIQRLGRNWYWDRHEREYGFSYSEGLLHLRYGRQTMDSSTEQSKGWFLPWTQWRHVRHSLYGLDGEFFAHVPEASYRLGSGSWEEARRIIESCPTRTFAFADFDGEELLATTKIEEREWRFGTGWFKWLSAFRRPKIRRSLDIDFSGETGRRKGSWKGGTLGHSIEMLPGELHEAAFQRYCVQHNMTFIGKAEA